MMGTGIATKRLLIIGPVGAALTMIGDYLLMGVDTYGAQSMVDSYLIAAQEIGAAQCHQRAFDRSGCGEQLHIHIQKGMMHVMHAYRFFLKVDEPMKSKSA